VTITRPDLVFAVNKYGRYTINPTSIHFNTMKRIYKYLAGTISLGLYYKPNIYNTSLNSKGKLVLWINNL